MVRMMHEIESVYNTASVNWQKATPMRKRPSPPSPAREHRSNSQALLTSEELAMLTDFHDAPALVVPQPNLLLRLAQRALPFVLSGFCIALASALPTSLGEPFMMPAPSEPAIEAKASVTPGWIAFQDWQIRITKGPDITMSPSVTASVPERVMEAETPKTMPTLRSLNTLDTKLARSEPLAPDGQTSQLVQPGETASLAAPTPPPTPATPKPAGSPSSGTAKPATKSAPTNLFAALFSGSTGATTSSGSGSNILSASASRSTIANVVSNLSASFGSKSNTASTSGTRAGSSSSSSSKSSGGSASNGRGNGGMGGGFSFGGSRRG